MFYFIILITLTTGRTRTGEKGLPGPPGHREVERDKKSKRVPGTICEDVPMQETNEKQKEMGGKKEGTKKEASRTCPRRLPGPQIHPHQSAARNSSPLAKEEI